MDLKGARELIEEFEDIAKENSRPDRLIKNTVKRSFKRGAKPIVAKAKALAPRSDEGGPHMADKIAVTTRLSRRQRRQGRYGSTRAKSEVQMFIGAAPKGPAVLVEFGTGPRYQKTTGRYTGAVSPQPFMRPAWEQGKHQLASGFVDDLADELRKTAERARKRQMKKAGIK
ncbi:MAG: hypothetical protein CMB99_16495 [Flavobacteriaceae bacterium]|jgi:HK97 gp10 family phage protein|nr:hypothetical protein [Flavobacteriaceae bacterium]|tara:strand:+ start:4244 stop:4756 length:513 start_codon:yes stop_codon:yes gene_type:complete